MTADGLTHVIGFQMGRFDPLGTTYIPGLRENLYGSFTVNLGVYVPEVARIYGCGEAKRAVHEYDCCIRTRLKSTAEDNGWWTIAVNKSLIAELLERLQVEAFPFFQRFERRDQILDEYGAVTDNSELMVAPRIVCAIILLYRGEREEARHLLAAQARDRTCSPRHQAYVIDLAQNLDIAIDS